MNRDQKAAVIDELAGQLKAAEAVFAVDYRGISVSDAADLRIRLREAETVFRVVKNSLTERASDAAGVESLKPMLEGPTALVFVAGDAAVAAKALSDAGRTLGTLEFKGGLLNGSPLAAEEVRMIARLPARDILHGQLVGTVAAPLSGLVRTLNALIAGLAVQLGQIGEQGLVTGEAPPPEPEATADEAPSEPEAEAPPEPEAEAPPEPEAEAAPEPEAEAAPEPEAEAAADEEQTSKPAAESEDASASEAPAPEAETDQSEPEAHSASDADESADETEAASEPSDEPQEEA